MSLKQAAETILEAAQARERLEVHLCNAYTLSLVDSDASLESALASAQLNLPDGSPVAWLGRQYGVREPVRGRSLASEVIERGRRCGLRHYLYGGAYGVAQEMAERLAAEHPGAAFVGMEAPPYRNVTDGELDELLDRIDATQADVVWIGLGTPKQDYLVPRLASRLGRPVVPIGAAFDFFAKRIGEAPSILHGTGFEWLYRLAREPRRLWRRYLIGNPRFLINVIRHELRE